MVAVLTGALMVAMTSGIAGAKQDPDKADCKKGGWKDFATAKGTAFKNQGACVSYATKGGTLVPDACTELNKAEYDGVYTEKTVRLWVIGDEQITLHLDNPGTQTVDDFALTVSPPWFEIDGVAPAYFPPGGRIDVRRRRDALLCRLPVERPGCRLPAAGQDRHRGRDMAARPGDRISGGGRRVGGARPERALRHAGRRRPERRPFLWACWPAPGRYLPGAAPPGVQARARACEGLGMTSEEYQRRFEDPAFAASVALAVFSTPSSASDAVIAALELVGRQGGPSRLPARSLTAAERAELRALLLQIGDDPIESGAFLPKPICNCRERILCHDDFS